MKIISQRGFSGTLAVLRPSRGGVLTHDNCRTTAGCSLRCRRAGGAPAVQVDDA